jgi:hypothetical protein
MLLWAACNAADQARSAHGIRFARLNAMEHFEVESIAADNQEISAEHRGNQWGWSKFNRTGQWVDRDLTIPDRGSPLTNDSRVLEIVRAIATSHLRQLPQWFGGDVHAASAEAKCQGLRARELVGRAPLVRASRLSRS